MLERPGTRLGLEDFGVVEAMLEFGFAHEEPRAIQARVDRAELGSLELAYALDPRVDAG